jgi:hypothetical protein
MAYQRGICIVQKSLQALQKILSFRTDCDLVADIPYGFAAIQHSIKKGPEPGLFTFADFDMELLGEARRRDVTAVSADDSAGYGIIVTSSSTESAAKESGDPESAGDLLKFLFTHKTGASPA